MNNDCWKNSPIERNNSEKWATLKNNNIIEYETLHKLISTLNKWHPAVPVLISQPGGHNFSAPAFYEEVANKILKKYQINLLVSMFIFIIGTALVFISALATNAAIFWQGSALFMLLSFSIYFDYRLSKNDISALNERSLFFYWIFNSKTVKHGFIIWLMIIIVTGISQTALIKSLGNIDGLYEKSGAIHKKIIEGEYWRLLSGPLIHNTIPHFLNNAVFVLIIGPVSWGLYKTKSLLVFMIGNVAGTFAATIQFMHIDKYPFDVYGGISSGIFALFGYLIGDHLTNKDVLPKKLAFQLFLLTVASIFAADIFSKTAASVSHVVGFLTGMVSGFFTYKLNAIRSNQDLTH
jgi:membrane associated rhomboid family serine protease